MKIYHKFLLYQNKLLKPYVRILLGLVEALTYLASLLLIVGVVYEHGFPLSIDEVANLQTLYKTVWIIFLIDVTLHISLEYRNTKKQYRRLAWILSGLPQANLVTIRSKNNGLTLFNKKKTTDYGKITLNLQPSNSSTCKCTQDDG